MLLVLTQENENVKEATKIESYGFSLVCVGGVCGYVRTPLCTPVGARGQDQMLSSITLYCPFNTGSLVEQKLHV